VNHLAHLLLAPREPMVRLGNLLGDFVRGHDVASLPAPVRAGIEQHRAIDRFTDAHAMFRRSRARVSAPLRRFSGVLVDVFYDHFVARDWARLGEPLPLRAFTAEVYGLLRAHAALLPERLRTALPPMIARDWLAACGDLDGVAAVLHRLSLRLRRPVALAAGAEDLRRHRAAFAADFAAFWPDVAAFARAAAAPA
jgi:acyl carrier protein phosphodiesterase